MEPRPARYFETHVHPPPGSEGEEALERASRAGVGRFLAVAADLTSAAECRRLAEARGDVWFAAGAHPHAARAEDARPSAFARVAESGRLAAVGEVGLDYHYMSAPRDAQRDVFARFLDWALELGRPAVVHCRPASGEDQAFEDAHALLEPFAKAGGRFAMHCFAGDLDWARRFLEIGAFVGVAGIVTFPKGGNIRALAAALPADRLLIETDAPYLAPVPHRGKPNAPEYLPLVAEGVARARGQDACEVAASTWRNACVFLGLEP